MVMRDMSNHPFADIGMVALILMIIVMMIIPLPTWFLDLLIVGNISLALLVILVSMYISNGLEFAAFPTLLLITTLYRLALNVSSTRLILLQADAGEVIQAFGSFVVQGDYIVGGVIFLILTLIQFLVITKGSERVAEVGARFTLDAMPGKQMSIDAELRMGSISQEEARLKRRELQKESQFYGAMDGAMKFVKGDTIAGIIITMINIVGGLIVGTLASDMNSSEALQTYGLLTIGDGVVSQIPALLISTSAGLVVTRVVSKEHQLTLGSDLVLQVFSNVHALRVASIFLCLLGLVPGLPALPFFVLGSLVFLFSHIHLTKKQPKKNMKDSSQHADWVSSSVSTPLVIPLCIELGPRLRQMADPTSNILRDVCFPSLQDKIYWETGVRLPLIHTRLSSDLEDDHYLLLLQEVPIGFGWVKLDHYFVLEGFSLNVGGSSQPLNRDFFDKIPGDVEERWISKDQLDKHTIKVLTPAEYIVKHLEIALSLRLRSFVGIQEVQTMLDQLEEVYPAVIRHVVPKLVSISVLRDVLCRLVDEKVNIRPLREILESLSSISLGQHDPFILTELVRVTLGRQITYQHLHGKVLSAYLLSSEIEETFRDGIKESTSGRYFVLPPSVSKDIVEKVKSVYRSNLMKPVIVTQSDIRRYVYDLLYLEVENLSVLSIQELAPEIQVRTLETEVYSL